MRADPLTHADVEPAIEAIMRIASGNRIHADPNSALILSIACIMPCTTAISDCGTASARESVEPTYAIAQRTPPSRMARGKVRRGFSYLVSHYGPDFKTDHG